MDVIHIVSPLRGGMRGTRNQRRRMNDGSPSPVLDRPVLSDVVTFSTAPTNLDRDASLPSSLISSSSLEQTSAGRHSNSDRGSLLPSSLTSPRRSDDTSTELQASNSGAPRAGQRPFLSSARLSSAPSTPNPGSILLPPPSREQAVRLQAVLHKLEAGGDAVRDAYRDKILTLSRSDTGAYLEDLGADGRTSQSTAVLWQRLFLLLELGSLPHHRHTVSSLRVVLPALYGVASSSVALPTRESLLAALRRSQNPLPATSLPATTLTGAAPLDLLHLLDSPRVDPTGSSRLIGEVRDPFGSTSGSNSDNTAILRSDADAPPDIRQAAAAPIVCPLGIEWRGDLSQDAARRVGTNFAASAVPPLSAEPGSWKGLVNFKLAHEFQPVTYHRLDMQGVHFFTCAARYCQECPASSNGKILVSIRLGPLCNWHAGYGRRMAQSGFH
jgi:hypothetical protein